MLVHLRVRDLALIEDLDLPLSEGFTVLTGETGAGKSLVATAIGLLLGGKAGPEQVRRGAEAAEVEGLFDVSDEPATRRRLEDAGLPGGDELLVRRVVPAEGRQRVFVNGRIASLALLAELADGLASFAGQHEHHALLRPDRQREILDAFGGHREEVLEMGRLHVVAAEARERLESLLARDRDRAQRLDFLSFQLREIEALDPAPDELETLARDISRLRHLSVLRAATAGAAEELYEADGSVFERLSGRAAELERAAEHDADLAAHAERLAEAAALVEEAARALGGYGEGLEADPARLDELEERREALAALVRKHGMDLEALLARRGGIEEEVRALSRYDEAVREARDAAAVARDAAIRHAAALTAARRRAAKRLAKAVSGELDDLALGAARFAVGVLPADGEPGPTGADRVELTVALNPGEGEHPLRQTASGGELSRLMLAIRRAVAGTGPTGTYVFDEVDAGIGGSVAAAVGRKLREVAREHQVLVITHLPQIAGLADSHLVVRKSGRKGRTVSEVRRLADEERVQEIARMVGGDELTERTVAAARELLAAGRGHRVLVRRPGKEGADVR